MDVGPSSCMEENYIPAREVLQVSCTPQRENELWRFTVVLDIVRLSHTLQLLHYSTYKERVGLLYL